MKLHSIVVLFLFAISSYSYAQTQEPSVQNNENPPVITESIANTGVIEKGIARNPAMDLIEKNGSLVFAEVTLKGNLTHVFSGKVNDSTFDKSIENVKSKEFILSLNKINATEYQVDFKHGVTDTEQRLFYEILGYSGYSYKNK